MVRALLFVATLSMTVNLSGGIFVDDGEIAVATRCKRVFRGGIESRGVGTLANRWGSHHLAAVRVHNRHNLFIAHREETPAFEIHGQSGGTFARGQWPAVGLGQFLRVELDQLRGVFIVDEDAALAVGCGEFRLTSQGQRADDRAIGGVDGSGVFPRPLKVKTRFETGS